MKYSGWLVGLCAVDGTSAGNDWSRSRARWCTPWGRREVIIIQLYFIIIITSLVTVIVIVVDIMMPKRRLLPVNQNRSV